MPHPAFTPAYNLPGQRPPREHHPLSDQTETLLQIFQKATHEPGAHAGPRIRVNAVASTFAGIYERIRNAIEYHEDHLLRKNATDRILRRRLLFGFGVTPQAQSLAKLLIMELIRGGYLPNDQLPESKINDVAAIINKYLLLNQQLKTVVHGIEARAMLNWVTSVMATDIEELLVPPTRAEAMVTFAYQVLRKDILWQGFQLDERERDLQLYLAVHRALIRSDAAIVRTHLLHLYVPRWRTADETVIAELTAKLPRLRLAIDRQVNHPQGDTILHAVKKFSMVFLILKDVIENAKDSTGTLTDPTSLKAAIKAAADKRYLAVRLKINRSVLRTVIYIFLTKTILALLIEFPYEVFVVRHLNYLPLAVNIAFHPLFLFAIAVSVRVPTEKNTQRIAATIESLLYTPNNRSVPLEIRKPRRGVMTTVFRIIYALTFILSFGLLVTLLRQGGFNVASTVLFLFFLSIVSFFGIRLRQITRELIVIGERENIVTTTIDFFTVPIIQVGRWISTKAPKINVLIFVLDFIIEAPLKTLIEVVEDWFSFLREKKEEVY